MKAIAAGSGTAKTAKLAECEASQSGGEAASPNLKGGPQDMGADATPRLICMHCGRVRDDDGEGRPCCCTMAREDAAWLRENLRIGMGIENSEERERILRIAYMLEGVSLSRSTSEDAVDIVARAIFDDDAQWDDDWRELVRVKARRVLAAIGRTGE